MTTAFITGITGFVGSHLADHLLAETDWDIVGMARWRSPLDNIAGLTDRINRGDRVRLVYADLRDGISIDKAVRDARPDYVFHLAAQSFPKTSFDAPLDTLDTNVQGTVRLLEACRHHAPLAWVHVCSSSEVYGRAERLPITEDAPFHPASPYAVSKVGADLMARHYAEAYGLNIIVTRMFTHTGPRRGDVFHESSFAKQIAMIEAKMIPPVIKVGNLKSRRTYADVRDAVRAYRMALTINPVSGSVYNIGGDHVCEVGDTLGHLIETANITVAVEKDANRMRPVDADLQVPDCRRFKAHTGWRSEIGYETTMADLLAYWRAKVRTGAILQR